MLLQATMELIEANWLLSSVAGLLVVVVARRNHRSSSLSVDNRQARELGRTNMKVAGCWGWQYDCPGTGGPFPIRPGTRCSLVTKRSLARLDVFSTQNCKTGKVQSQPQPQSQ